MKRKATKVKKPHHYWCSVWKMNYYYFIYWDHVDYELWLMNNLNYKTSLESSNGNCILSEKDNAQIICIWVREETSPSVLAHECVHAAVNTLSQRGWIPDFENEEPLCYLVEDIFENAPTS